MADKKKFALIINFFVVASILGCVEQAPIDPNAEVPPGDPAFPLLFEYGIHDPNNILSEETKGRANKILERLNDEGTAQVAVLIQYNVYHPEDYATHFGRYIGLGQMGKDNGLVYLIRPDVNPQDGRITVSIGRGLPKFTAVDAYKIIKEVALDQINQGDYNTGVLDLVKSTDERLREIYGSGKNGG